MSESRIKLCAKCGTENRTENSYCKKCGTVLGVSSETIRAQIKPITPDQLGIKWRYIFIGTPMMLGIGTALLAGAVILGFKPAFVEAETTPKVVHLVLIAAALQGAAFFIGGIILALISRLPVSRESAAASALAVLLLGAIGSSLTIDFLITACVALAPSIAAGWLGARVGRFNRNVEIIK